MSIEEAYYTIKSKQVSLSQNEKLVLSHTLRSNINTIYEGVHQASSQAKTIIDLLTKLVLKQKVKKESFSECKNC